MEVVFLITGIVLFSIVLTFLILALTILFGLLLKQIISPSVNLLTIDADEGALVEIKNSGSSILAFDLLDVLITVPWLSTGGIQRLFNIVLQPGQVMLLKIQFSRPIRQNIGTSYMYQMQVMTYAGRARMRKVRTIEKRTMPVIRKTTSITQ